MDISADYSQVESGVWTPTFKGASFLVAHLTCVKFQRALQRLQQPYRKKLSEGSLDPAKHRDILCDAMAEGLIYDWSGVVRTVDGQSVNVPFSMKDCATALKKDPEFRDFITDFANNLDNFIKEEAAELGND